MTVLLDQPAGRAVDVLSRPRLRHHPPQRLRRRGCRLPAVRPGGRRPRWRLRPPRDSHLSARPRDLAHLIPLVIQDKTFVPRRRAAGRPGSDLGRELRHHAGRRTDTGDLWFPHVYMPNQNPADPGGGQRLRPVGLRCLVLPAADEPDGRQPAHAVTIPCTSAAFPGQMLAPTSACPTCGCPITPNPSGTPEAFMDTPVVNGTAYPVLHVAPAAYRFKILSAGNDRSWNLSLVHRRRDARAVTEVAMLPAVPPASGYGRCRSARPSTPSPSRPWISASPRPSWTRPATR